MKESGLWATVSRNVSRFGLFERIENLLASGIPDVNFLVKGIEGWIELKHERNWPTRANTVMRFKIQDGQRLWWKNRRTLGGRVFVFAQVEKCYFLFDAYLAADHLSIDWTQQDMKDNAICWWSGLCDWREMVKTLIQYQTEVP